MKISHYSYYFEKKIFTDYGFNWYKVYVEVTLRVRGQTHRASRGVHTQLDW